MTEPLFYNDKIQVGNKTMLHRTLIERRVCRFSHLLHEHGTFLSLDVFNRKYGLDTDFLPYNGCVHTVNCTKSLDINVPSNKFSNLRKSLTMMCKVYEGTNVYYDTLVENESKPKCCIKWNSTLSKNIYWYTAFYKIENNNNNKNNNKNKQNNNTQMHHINWNDFRCV